jgi:uncharacterized protein (TIGR03435 family)
MLKRMRTQPSTIVLVLLSSLVSGHAQSVQPSFDVASVRASQHEVGPDYSNQVNYAPGEFTGHNVTLKRLVADAWHCQLNQVVGPVWLDRNEYEVSARMPDGTNKEQLRLMLRSLLAERFHLKEHSENRSMRVYELTVGQGGPRIHPIEAGGATTAGPGFHFHGEMRQFADLLAVQFSIPAIDNPNVPVKAGGAPIPVLDKTGLQGVYDFSVEQRPELGTDAFTAWKRILEEQLGLKIESRTADVPVVVVDEAAKMPTEN